VTEASAPSLDLGLKRLHLANARRIWRDLVARAEQEQLGYETFPVSVKIVVRKSGYCTMHGSMAALAGLRKTAPMGFQLRVAPVQRRGVRRLARV